MIVSDIWPKPPICDCPDWFEGWTSGFLQGVSEGRAEVIAEQLERQQRSAEQIEPAASVIAGLRALEARQKRPIENRRTAA